MAHPKGGYKLADGTRLLGVTTVVGRFKDSGALLFWACEQGKAIERGEINNLYDKRDEAGETGTGTHWLVYQHVNGKAPLDLSTVSTLDMGEDGQLQLNDDYRQQLQAGFDAYLAWEKMTKLKILAQEMQLVCPTYGFGGCPDAVGMIDNEPCLIDWKTSKAVYPDMLMQLAAYGHLCEHGLLAEQDYKPLSIKVKGFHLCKFNKTYGSFSHHYYPQLDVPWEQFKAFLECYKRDKIIKAMV